MPLLLDREEALARQPVLARTLADERAAHADPPRTPPPRPDHRGSMILQADPPGARPLVQALHRWLRDEPILAVPAWGTWLPGPLDHAPAREAEEQIAAWVEDPFDGGLVGRPRELFPVLYWLARCADEIAPVWFAPLHAGFAARACRLGNLHVEVCTDPAPLRTAWDDARLATVGRCVERQTDGAVPERRLVID